MAPVVYFCRDLLFTSKIRETARQLGITVEAAKDLAGLELLATSARLVIIDLRLPEALPALDRLAKVTVPKVGFIDHEKTDLMERASQKGCDRVLAKGKFSTELSALMAGSN